MVPFSPYFIRTRWLGSATTIHQSPTPSFQGTFLFPSKDISCLTRMAARMDRLSAALRDVQVVHDSDDLDDIEEKLPPPPPLHARDVSQGSQESGSRFAPSTADTEEDDERERLHQQHLQRQHHMMMSTQTPMHQPPPSMLAMAQNRQLKSASSSPQTTKMLLRPNSSQSIIETGSISSSTTAPYEPRRRLGTNSTGSNSSASIGSVMVRGGVKPSTDERTGFARIYFENQNFTSSTVFKLFVNTTVLEVRAHADETIRQERSSDSLGVAGAQVHGEQDQDPSVRLCLLRHRRGLPE